jgi:hypothetical protein
MKALNSIQLEVNISIWHCSNESKSILRKVLSKLFHNLPSETWTVLSLGGVHIIILFSGLHVYLKAL